MFIDVISEIPAVFKFLQFFSGKRTSWFQNAEITALSVKLMDGSQHCVLVPYLVIWLMKHQNTSS